MFKRIGLIFTFVAFYLTSFGQFTSITYDLERNWFNEGHPLPAETDLIVKGSIPTDATRVEFVILSANKSEELYTAVWNKTNTNDLSLAVPYKLRSSSEYDFLIRFFEPMNAYEKEKLEQAISNTINAYLDVNLAGNNSIKLLKNSKKKLKEMNRMLADIFTEYRSSMLGWEPEFSEIIQLKLEELERADLKDDYSKIDSSSSKKQVMNQAREKLVGELNDQIRREVSQLLDRPLFTLKDTRFVDNYSTESKKNALAINLGYGGVYLSGNIDNFTYDSAPYIGLAFPFGNEALASNFLSKTSLTFGVFLDNFEDADQMEVNGFLIDRPIYVGLDYKLFQFVHFNAGATFLEEANEGTISSNSIIIRPFIGLSARIDLSIGLGK